MGIDIVFLVYNIKQIKMNFKKLGIGLTIMAVFSMAMPSCKSQEKKDAEAKAKIEATLAPGTSVEVNDGVATLNGTFESEASKAGAEENAKKVAGVKSVVNNATVPAPVVVSPDETLTNSVNQVLSNYQGVSAQVQNGVVTLTGTTNRADLQNLMQAVNALNPVKVENQLTVK